MLGFDQSSRLGKFGNPSQSYLIGALALREAKCARDDRLTAC